MDVRGKRVLVMGLGRFGGGVGAARYLADRGARVIVTDLASSETLADSVVQLNRATIEALHLGSHRREDFIWAEVVVVNPAVPPEHPLLSLAQSHGAQLISEVGLFLSLCPAPTIGVTGSNGKSTTAALVHAMFKAAGRSSWLGGNIGGSLLEQLDQIQATDWVVLELSSFQLESIDSCGRSPCVALVTNFTPNHLDRHGGIAAYRRAKQTILRHQRPDDLAVLCADDAEVRSWAVRGQKLYYGLSEHGDDGATLRETSLSMRWQSRQRESRFEFLDALRLPGRHNLQNAVGAALCAWALGVEPVCIREALAGFRPLEHRLELVGELGGRRFFDDSKATTPEATAAALAAIQEPIWLIAGGADKGLDLALLAQRIRRQVKGVVLLGDVGIRLGELLAGPTPENRRPCISYSEHMDSAVAWCFAHSEAGEAIVLSPASASFGMFVNYVQRGRAFRQAVEALRSSAS